MNIKEIQSFANFNFVKIEIKKVSYDYNYFIQVKKYVLNR